MQISPLIRKSFPAEGVQVTKENFLDVASWCGGVLKGDGNEAFIKVEVTRPIHERQTQARIGDWIIKVGHGFKVFTQESFERSFDILPVEESDEVLEGLVIHQTNHFHGSAELKRQVEETFDTENETRPTVRGW